MRYISYVILFGIALFICTPVFASDDEQNTIPDVWERGCGDDDGNDRCDTKVQERMRTRYGWKSIEQLAEENTTTYRAMIIDGYGNDLVAISFERQAGMSPFVEVRVPNSDNVSIKNQPLKANISEQVWSDVVASSEHFDQKLASEVADKGDNLPICFHGWVTVAESVSIRYYRNAIFAKGEKSVKDKKKVTLKRDVESACAGGLAIPFAFRLAQIAHTSLTECSTLKVDEFRNKPTLLSACRNMSGDRLAAGNLYRAFRKIRDIGDFPLEEFKRLFDYHSREQALQSYDALLDGRFYYEKIYAESEENGKIVGKIYKSAEDESVTLMANILLNYNLDGGEFKIISYELSEFIPEKEK